MAWRNILQEDGQSGEQREGRLGGVLSWIRWPKSSHSVDSALHCVAWQLWKPESDLVTHWPHPIPLVAFEGNLEIWERMGMSSDDFFASHNV